MSAPCEGRVTSIISLLAHWLLFCLGSRAKLLPQQPERVVRELVSRPAHSAQLDWVEVGVGGDVGGRAVQLVESKPEAIRIHLD